MFFFGPKVLLLLKRHSLEIYYKNSDKVMVVQFHSTALRHLEVLNRDEIVKTLVEAFKNANLGKAQAVIALSDHIVFEKLISTQDPGVTQKEINRFYHNIPLDEAHIARKIIPLKGSALALAANRELYKLVIEVAHEFEWKIRAVIPMTPFAKLSEDEQLAPEQVNHILNSDQIFKEADFLNESLLAPEAKEDDKKEEGDEDSSDELKPSSRTKNITTVLIALFLLSLILGSLFYFKIINLPFSLPWFTQAPLPATSTIPEASKSAEVAPESTASANTQEASVSAEFNRSEIRIHVLNGSDIAGQAGKIKEKLAEIGYENVITGNIESSEASGSAITYSQGLEVSIRDEINGLMNSLIEGISTGEEAISEFNVIITLGKLRVPIE